MQFKRLAHGVSLLISLVMGIMLLVTSSKMANLYTKYCDKDYNFVYNNNDFSSPYHHNYQAECEQNENHFLILPLFGYFTLCAWVRLIMSCNILNMYSYKYPYYPPKSYFTYLLNS